ncbi:hypothetical protein [Serratia symbiotica]|uniref:hypothetical protein n=1 Tax=Serratia symbiotica TaxID=138074 RepID=UPI001CF0B6E3|nr:hypothetical protein [Serratia symbiotica]
MDSFDYSVNVQMPAHFHKDDEKWIREMLLHLDPITRNKIIMKYGEVYQSGWEMEPVSFKKDNRARHEANTRLRVFIRKYATYSRGNVSKPELFKQH